MSIWYYLDAVVEKDPVHGQELSRCIPACPGPNAVKVGAFFHSWCGAGLFGY